MSVCYACTIVQCTFNNDFFYKVGYRLIRKEIIHLLKKIVLCLDQTSSIPNVITENIPK